MSDLGYYQKILNHISDFDKYHLYHQSKNEKSLISKLLENCEALAVDSIKPKIEGKNNYLKGFYAEYQAMARTLSPENYTTPKRQSNLFGNLGWRNGVCEGKKKLFPILLAWYYWKTEKLINDLGKGNLPSKIQTGRIFHEEMKLNAIYPSPDAHGEDIKYQNNFKWVEPIFAEVSIEEEALNLDLLNPYNRKGIKFFGRDEEIGRLNNFAEDNAWFKIWTVIAPSGAGKTRLVFEWTQRKEIKTSNWEVFYIGRDPNGSLVFHDPDHIYKNPHRADTYFKGVEGNGSDWRDWSPKKDTILIIDYVSGFEDIINGIVNRCVRHNTGLNHRVRLLVLDHVFPESLKMLDSDERWHPIHDITKCNDIFFEDKPLFLTKTEDQSKVIKKIILHVAESPAEGAPNINFSVQQIEQAEEYLRNTEGAWHPLFAALVGDAIQSGRSFSHLDRRKLIEGYLDHKERLPWKFPKLEDKSNNAFEEWIRLYSCVFVSAATVLDGVQWQSIVNADYSGINKSPENFKPIKTACERLISNRIESIIPPFVPDIIGESFFLLFLKEIEERPKAKALLYTVLASGTLPQQSDNALAFVKVIKRLARNLLNDDYNLKETQLDWMRLNAFLLARSKHLEVNELTEWATATAFFEISNHIQAIRMWTEIDKTIEFNSPNESIFLKAIDKKALLLEKITSKEIADLAVVNATKYYKLGFNAGTLNSYDLSEFIDFLQRYDSSSPATPALHIVLYFQFPEAALKLLEVDYDLSKLDSDNISALFYACSFGQENIALKLIEGMDNFEDRDHENMTVLMLSCRFNYQKVALALIEKMKKVDQVDSKRWTALMFACAFDREQISLKLIDKMDSVSQQNDSGMTALMYACRDNHNDACTALVEKMKTFNQANTEGKTALMFACYKDNVFIASKLINKMTSGQINKFYLIKEDFGKTALDIAIDCASNYLVKILKEAGAKTYVELPEYFL